MTERQQQDLLHDEVQAGTQTGLASPSVDVTNERQNSLWSDAWKALKRNPLFWIGAVFGAFFTLMAIAPQWFARGADPRSCDLANSRSTPSAEHWFGFDQQGCDYLANVVYGARNSLIIGILAVLVILVLGVMVGALAGFLGGGFDGVLSRITDIFYALPLILGALVILRTGILGRGVVAVAVALAVFGWMTAMRLVRSQVIAVKTSDYVAAARAMGASNRRILARHILPNAV